MKNPADSDLVCVCMYVSHGTILTAIKANKLTTVEEVGEHTEAGSNCGACRVDIEKILDECKTG